MIELDFFIDLLFSLPKFIPVTLKLAFLSLMLSLSLAVLSCGLLLVQWFKGTLLVSASLSFLLTALGAVLVFSLRPVTDFSQEGYLFPLAVMLTVPRALFAMCATPLPPSRTAARLIGLLLIFVGLLSISGRILGDPLWQALLLRITVLPFAFFTQLFLTLLPRRSRGLAVIGALLPLPLAIAVFWPKAIYACPILAVFFILAMLRGKGKSE